MTDRSASRRAFLGAAGAGIATAGAGPWTRPRPRRPPRWYDVSAPGSDAGQDAAPPTIPGTLTKTLLFCDAAGFGLGATNPLAFAQGAYGVAGGFLSVSLGLDAGAVIRRIDVYVNRVTTGSVSFSLNKASVTTSGVGVVVDSIQTASGTGVLTGGKTMTVPVAAGEQYYVESGSFTSSNATFIARS